MESDDAAEYYHQIKRYISMAREIMSTKFARALFIHERRHLLDHILHPRLFELWSTNPIRTLRFERRAIADSIRLLNVTYGRQDLRKELQVTEIRAFALSREIEATIRLPADEYFATFRERRMGLELRHGLELEWEMHLGQLAFYGPRLAVARTLLDYRGPAMRDVMHAPMRALYRLTCAIDRWRESKRQYELSL